MTMNYNIQSPLPPLPLQVPTSAVNFKKMYVDEYIIMNPTLNLVEAEYSEDTEEANSIETTSSEENAFDNVLSLFNIENDLSDESLTSFYHENSIANNHLVNGSVSHPEFDPITESGSVKLSAMWFVIWLSLSLLFNWR